MVVQEARRIDNQLRGRSGRQGDPGSTRFFLSLEDKCAPAATSPPAACRVAPVLSSMSLSRVHNGSLQRQELWLGPGQ